MGCLTCGNASSLQVIAFTRGVRWSGTPAGQVLTGIDLRYLGAAEEDYFREAAKIAADAGHADAQRSLPQRSTEEQGLRGDPFRVLDFTQQTAASRPSDLPREPSLPVEDESPETETGPDEPGMRNVLIRPFQDLLQAAGERSGDAGDPPEDAVPRAVQRAVSGMLVPFFNLPAVKSLLGAGPDSVAEEVSLGDEEGDVDQSGQLDIEVEIEHTGSGRVPPAAPHHAPLRVCERIEKAIFPSFRPFSILPLC